MGLNKQEAKELAKRNKGLAILNEIAGGLNRSVSINAALKTTLAKVAELFGLETGWIWLVDSQSGDFYLAAAQNLPPALRDNPASMHGSCHCIDTYQAGTLGGASNINIITCTRLQGLVDGTDGLRHHASVPLQARDGSNLGILNVASRDWRGLSDYELDLLHTVGDLLSIAVERARLYDRSVEMGALKERNRLAREIHDTLAQNLSAITLQLEALDAMVETGEEAEKLKPLTERLLALARNGLTEARNSVLDLRAAPLEGRTLAEALQILAEDIEARAPFTVSFESHDCRRSLPPNIEIGLYRIAQEALTNVEKHADAQSVEIELEASTEWIQLSVSDDGIGFEFEGVKDNGHFGLKGISERTKLLKGSAHLETCPGNGTRLWVRVPFSSSPKPVHTGKKQAISDDNDERRGGKDE